MPPFLALLLWIILLALLLYFDPARSSKASIALWIPVIWIFILGSRLPSQWFDGQVAVSAQAFEEGNPLDRIVFCILILLAIVLLISRSFRWGAFLAQNITLIAFLLFALASVGWSDYPFVTFKHWFRDLGNYLVILIVLSDARPQEALSSVLRRVCYMLVPLSVVLVKYYPELGRQYDGWTGVATYAGAATSKNMLGVICLISGVFFFWDTIGRWGDRKRKRERRIILVNLAFVAMTLWLLNLAKSATSSVCLVLGCGIVAAAHARAFRHRPKLLRRLVPLCLCLCVAIALTFNVSADVIGALGRDPTLTDRTVIWQAVLNTHTNPLIGTGYDSFWLGPRLQQLWQIPSVQGVNEAHNGYLEIYLNLGVVGLALLITFLIASYRTICAQLKPFSNVASLGLALWTMMLFYSVTEAGFRGGLLWAAFLSAVLVVPVRVTHTAHVVAAYGSRDTEISSFLLGSTSRGR